MAQFTKRSGKISQRLLAIGILPLLLFALIILILGYYLFSHSMYEQVDRELKNVSDTLLLLVDETWPGDYALVAGETDSSLRVLKGETDITSDYSLVDRVKENTGLDITLFYQDTRILTTITDRSGVRIIGTGAAKQIVDKVIASGEEAFYHNTKINGEEFFSYYRPLTNSDGSIVGMLFVGQPCKEVNRALFQSLAPLLIADALIILFIIILVVRYTKGISDSLGKIQIFLQDAASGKDDVEIDPSVINRNDELGEIGDSILVMHRSLRDTMEKDPLTHLFNRRSAHRKIANIMSKASAKQQPFSLAIGDIDFFKKVNDTYGHDAGDLVLVTVADTIREHMKDNGFVARWGGEEFLMVFDHLDLDAAKASLEDLLNKIRALEIAYEDQVIRLTMSFGVSVWRGLEEDALIKSADDKLYLAKDTGRNQVIAFIKESNWEGDKEEAPGLQVFGASEEENLNLAFALLDEEKGPSTDNSSENE